MLDLEQAARIIVDLLASSFYLQEFDCKTDLIEESRIDSAGLMQLFCELEREFNITIGIEDLQLEHFRTVDRIATFVIQKQRSAQGQGR